MGAAKGIPKNVKVKKDVLIKRIQDSMNHKGYIYARTMMGFILEKEEDCHGTGDKIIKQIKDTLGDDKFKVNICGIMCLYIIDFPNTLGTVLVYDTEILNN